MATNPDKQACEDFIKQCERDGYAEEAAAWGRVAASLKEPDPPARLKWGLIFGGASGAVLLVCITLLVYYR